jgi:hypothetical protein
VRVGAGGLRVRGEDQTVREIREKEREKRREREGGLNGRVEGGECRGGG